MAERLTAETRIKLNDQNTIPCIGLGVFSAPEGSVCQRAVETALEVGYRHIDTAADYGNEASVGRAIASSGIPRGEIFVTTKLWPGPDVKEVPGRLMASLEKLRTDYVDLYLIHWPVGCYKEAWKVLVELKKEGKCRSIGVSNYTTKRFERDFFPQATLPAVNQIELHAFNQQRALVTYCIGRGIALSAYSPLARAERLEHPVLKAVARQVGKSPAQVMIRFLLQRGLVAVPKSGDPVRIKENIDVFDFVLDDGHTAKLAALNDESYYSLRWRPAGYY